MHIEGLKESYSVLVERDQARVVGFEPNIAECEKLNALHGDKHLYLPHFIGLGRQETYYETNFTMTGSLYRPNEKILGLFQNLLELTTVVETHEVKSHRLDELEEIGDVDFLKIDVQGAELDVLRGGEQVLAGTMVVQAEVEFVEMYEGQPLFADVDIYLREQGFRFHSFIEFGRRCFKPIIVNNNINAGINQDLWANPVYVRDYLEIDAIPSEKMLKMAAIMGDVFGSFDLCLHLLNKLDERDGSLYAKKYLEAISSQSAGTAEPG